MEEGERTEGREECMKWSEMTHDERDRLVYEKVLKPVVCSGTWRIHTLDDGVRQICWCQTCGHECANELPNSPGSHERPAWNLRSYTRDMNAAWEVAERFDEIVISKHIPEKYHCELWRSTTRYVGIAKTVQDAICLAALKANKVEIEA